MHHQFKVIQILRPEDRLALGDLISSPTTIDEVHEWMLQRGYEINRSSVGNFLRAFRTATNWPWGLLGIKDIIPPAEIADSPACNLSLSAKDLEIIADILFLLRGRRAALKKAKTRSDAPRGGGVGDDGQLARGGNS